jgi:signal transduction histidine kinase
MTTDQSLPRGHVINPPYDLPTQVLDSLTASVAVVDKQGTIIATNEAWRDFACENGGDPARTGVGANYLEVCRVAQGADAVSAKQTEQGIRDVLEGKRDIFNLEYPCHSPTQQRWFLLHVSPLKGDPDNVVATHFLITDRKLVEKKLVETARLAAIGQAMKGLSHKGRNSLQRAQGFIDLLRSQVEHDPEAVKLVDRVETAQRRLLSLYEEVQHYAAPIHLFRSTHRLDALVRDAWDSLSPLTADFQFSQLPTEMDLTCQVDANAIGQALRSIFDNAMSSDPMASLIEVEYIKDSLDGVPAITVVVSDDGSGVPSEDRESVFEPFSTTKVFGTGLGLATCRRIAEAHGGRVCFGEPKRSGASVYLTLPTVT